jgi:hypothetical protein
MNLTFFCQIRRVLPWDGASSRPVGRQALIPGCAMAITSMVIKVETINQRSEKIIDETAEVAQPPTVYMFTSQGPKEPGMGMDPLRLRALFGMLQTNTCLLSMASPSSILSSTTRRRGPFTSAVSRGRLFVSNTSYDGRQHQDAPPFTTSTSALSDTPSVTRTVSFSPCNLPRLLWPLMTCARRV